MATKHSMEKVLSLAANFVIERNGVWDHDAWEGLLADMAGLGLEIEDDFKRNLGNILEAAKFFYCNLPSQTQTDAAPKPKPKAKAKPKAKKD